MLFLACPPAQAEEGAADDAQQHNEAMVRNMGFDAKSAKTALEKCELPPDPAPVLKRLLTFP